MQPEGRRQFRVDTCLGRGGFGEVYRARLRSPGGLETIVALKVLRSDVELDLVSIGRLRDEGRLLARINHPVVVRAFDLTSIEGRVGLVTEYVDGDDLDTCLRDPGRRIAAALDAAFSSPGPDGEPLRIVHRDVKPTNVRIGRHGQVKLLDFGIARFQAPDRESRTISDVVVGSVPYMAPERFVERASLPGGDVFGLGCCLYEGAAGHRFHVDGSLRAVSVLSLDAQRYDAHLAASLAELHTPDDLSALVGACLAFDPDARPSAGEVALRCEALADRLAGTTLRRWCADRRWVGAVAVSGELVGRTLVEGDLVLPPVDPSPASIGKPRFVQRPLGTIDPDGLPPDALPPMGLPDPSALPDDRATFAPLSGFPSLPQGVVLLEGPPHLLATDSASRPRRSGPAVVPVARRGSAPIVALGCAVVGLGAVASLLVGAVLGAWLGLQ
jgi:hypothetical protein